MRPARSDAALSSLDPALKHGEFVAAQPRHHTTLSHRARQPFGGFNQKAVARRMAQHVVDRLEAVEVDQVKCDRPAAAPGAHDLGAQPLLQHHPVGQPRQRVMMGDVMQMGLGLFALADIDRGRQYGGDGVGGRPQR